MENKYKVYVIIIKQGIKTYAYVGQGDAAEPRRRLYQVKRRINVNHKFDQLRSSSLKKAKKVLIVSNVSEDQSIIGEAYIIYSYMLAQNEKKNFVCLNCRL